MIDHAWGCASCSRLARRHAQRVVLSRAFPILLITDNITRPIARLILECEVILLLKIQVILISIDDVMVSEVLLHSSSRNGSRPAPAPTIRACTFARELYIVRFYFKELQRCRLTDTVPIANEK